MSLSSFNRDAALLYWGCELTWAQVAQALAAKYHEDVSYSRARSAGRRYKRKHPREFEALVCPPELHELTRAVGGECAQAPQSEEALSFEVDNNEAELTYESGPRPRSEPLKTLDELIAAHGIDLTEWELAGKVTHNTWTTPAFDKNLHQWTYFQNHQIKAPFVKRHPEPLHPQIQPVTPIEILPAPDPGPRDGAWREVIFGDVHLGYRRRSVDGLLTPFHDRGALDVLSQIVADLQPRRVHCVGDGMDAAELSDRYPRPPSLHETLQPGLCEWHWWLHDIRAAAPDAEMDYHEGNHEERLRRFLVAHFPAVYELRRADQLAHPPALAFENLLALDALGVRWIGDYPQDEDWSGNLRLRHGDTARKNPGSTAWAIVQDADSDEAFGHIHRQELVTKSIYGRHRRRVAQAFCVGCLCHVDGRVPGSSPDDYWSQGFVVRDFLPEGELASTTFVRIDEGRALFEGRLYEARDRVPELEAAYPQYKWGR